MAMWKSRVAIQASRAKLRIESINVGEHIHLNIWGSHLCNPNGKVRQTTDHISANLYITKCDISVRLTTGKPGAHQAYPERTSIR